MPEYKTREQWYYAAAKFLEQRVFKPDGHELPKFRIGCGWPVGNRAKVGAQCWDNKASGDKTYEIFISPTQTDPAHILEVIIHELCHAVAGIEAHHKKPFIEVMRTCGMVKPWKSSVAGEDLQPTLAKIAEKLGPYPHAKLGLREQIKKQTTRMVKLQCPECDYIVRTTRKHLEEKGAPICPIHGMPFQTDEERAE